MQTFEKKRVKELQKIASQWKIKGRSSFNRTELIRALVKRTHKQKQMRGGAISNQNVESFLANISSAEDPWEDMNEEEMLSNRFIRKKRLRLRIKNIDYEIKDIQKIGGGKIKICCENVSVGKCYTLEMENLHKSRVEDNVIYYERDDPTTLRDRMEPIDHSILNPYLNVESLSKQVQILIYHPLTESRDVYIFYQVLFMKPSENEGHVIFYFGNKYIYESISYHASEIDIYKNSIPENNNGTSVMVYSAKKNAILIIPKNVSLEKGFRGEAIQENSVYMPKYVFRYVAGPRISDRPNRRNLYENPISIRFKDVCGDKKNICKYYLLSISKCVKELIQFSYFFYRKMLLKALKSRIQISIMCPGQSPAYYALSMMCFDIYDPSKVNIISLPHSTGGGNYTENERQRLFQENSNRKYCERMREHNVRVHSHVVFLDRIGTGIGIKSFAKVVYECFDIKTVMEESFYSLDDTSFKTMDINQTKGYTAYALGCKNIFGDGFKRIVPSYKPNQFNHPIQSFDITEIARQNPLARMIRDCSRVYPSVQVEDTPWYHLNDTILLE